MEELFEGHSADTGAGKFLLVSMGGRAECLACADPGARTPIGASGNEASMLNYRNLLNILGKFSLWMKPPDHPIIPR